MPKRYTPPSTHVHDMFDITTQQIRGNDQRGGRSAVRYTPSAPGRDPAARLCSVQREASGRSARLGAPSSISINANHPNNTIKRRQSVKPQRPRAFHANVAWGRSPRHVYAACWHVLLTYLLANVQ